MRTKLFQVLVLIICSSAALHAQDYGLLNPNAAPQVKEFAFIVGHWDAKLSFKGADGAMHSAAVDWSARFILNGYAVQETWKTTLDATSEPTYGTAINAWDAQKGAWTCAEFTTPQTELLVMSGSLIGTELVQSHDAVSARDGANLKVKKYFFDIKPDSFKWRVDVSRDGGATWTDSGTLIIAQRIR